MCDKQIKNISSEQFFSMNLSSSSDPEFKLVRVIRPEHGNFMVDIRQTNKGAKTEAGACLLAPEFRWLVQVIGSNEAPKKSLDHGRRTIRVEKDEQYFTIYVKKANDTTSRVSLKNEEYNKLRAVIGNLENELLNLSRRCGIKIDFDEDKYIREY